MTGAMPPDATAVTLGEIVSRPGAALCGLVLGFEREWRAKDAGLRTHALVASDAAVITTSALSLYAVVRREGVTPIRCG
ncbi:MgtC/SapB family protein [Methylobacterium sp. 17Sr1-1]|uniref:MgtC/SapB family protein n=1 Tax=Methylobacterium sp. 17Sr1-1 TaxID=2202826 RepID=UPI0024781933|nr:MgtC/SapB family protein [Methylobacterium sp. 17Sr1-1]